MKRSLLYFLLFTLVVPISALPPKGVERFPKPEFQSNYVRPDMNASLPRSQTMEVIDLAILLLALSLASYLALKKRSRKMLFLLMLGCIVYFGFYREGCVCSVGSVQNVSLALFQPGYAIPISVILFFLLPLVFTLFFGRTFCSSVCPLGGIQDLVTLKQTRIPTSLATVFSILPYVYLGFALLFAANGAGFIICQYDPFIGFYRFGASFNMILLGVAFLILGTVVSRPYCRFLCPYGVLLRWMSSLSRKHATITPDHCSNCRLCEDSCPVDAIQLPAALDESADKKRQTRTWLILFLLLPVGMFICGWSFSKLSLKGSYSHHTVWLARQISLENQGIVTLPTDETKAFRASGKPVSDLMSEAEQIQKNFRIGGWVLGGILCLILFMKFLNLSIQPNRTQYEIDRGACISCGKCFIYCPYEKVRLGILSPDEVDNY